RIPNCWASPRHPQSTKRARRSRAPAPVNSRAFHLPEPRRAPVATREKPMWSRSRCALAPAPLAMRAVARRARYGQLRNACQGTWRSFCRSVLVAFYLARKVTYAESFRVAITDRALDVRDPIVDWLDARPPQCTGDAPRRARQGDRHRCIA